MIKLFEDVYEESHQVELPEDIKKYIDSLMDKLGSEAEAEFEAREKDDLEHADELKEYYAQERAEYESGERDYMYDGAKKRGLTYDEYKAESSKKHKQMEYERALSFALYPFKKYILDSMKRRGIDTKSKYYWD